jgi:hypothetical protein
MRRASMTCVSRVLLEVSAEMLKGIRAAFIQYDEQRARAAHLTE